MIQPTRPFQDLDRDIDALASARHADPFSILGPHRVEEQHQVRAWLPGALSVTVVQRDGEQHLLQNVRDGFFAGEVGNDRGDYTLRIEWPGSIQETRDPYSFGTLIDDDDLRRIAAGNHPSLADCLGAHPIRV